MTSILQFIAATLVFALICAVLAGCVLVFSIYPVMIFIPVGAAVLLIIAVIKDLMFG